MPELTVKTAGGDRKIQATQVAPNMALHRPLAHHLSRSHWDVTQISSGKRCGRFAERPQAINFAGLVVERVPVLARGGELSEEEKRLAREVREECGGIQ